MGIYDRDYYRSRPARSPFGTVSLRSATLWLVFLNFAVFFTDTVLWNRRVREKFGPEIVQIDPLIRHMFTAAVPRPLESMGAFSLTTAIGQGQFWRFLSFQFLHANFAHLAVNMLGLFLFGPIAEQFLGPRKFLAFYLLSGIAGALFYMLLLASGFLIGSAATPLVGASAGIFGVLVAAAMTAPDSEAMLFVIPIPAPIKFLALVMAAIAVFNTFSNGRNAGGEASHLGGAAMGFLLIRYPRMLGVFEFSFRRKSTPRRRVRFADWSKDLNH